MHRRELRIKAVTLALTVLCMLMLGTILFSLIEGWSLLDSFYFVSMTATTVGYGDFTPTHALSKIITVVYSLSIIPLMLYGFSMVARYQTDRFYKKIHSIEVNQKEQQEELEEEEKELEKAEKRIKKQEKELTEHDKELEVVEKVLSAKIQ